MFRYRGHGSGVLCSLLAWGACHTCGSGEAGEPDCKHFVKEDPLMNPQSEAGTENKTVFLHGLMGKGVAGR